FTTGLFTHQSGNRFVALVSVSSSGDSMAKEKPKGSNTRLKSDSEHPPILAASAILTRAARSFRSKGFLSFSKGLDSEAMASILALLVVTSSDMRVLGLIFIIVA